MVGGHVHGATDRAPNTHFSLNDDEQQRPDLALTNDRTATFERHQAARVLISQTLKKASDRSGHVSQTYKKKMKKIARINSTSQVIQACICIRRSILQVTQRVPPTCTRLHVRQPCGIFFVRRPRTPHGRRQVNRQGRDHHPLFPALAAVSGGGGGGEGVHRYLKISKIEKNVSIDHTRNCIQT